MDGINKSVSSLTFDNDDNIYAGVWTGSYQSPSNGEVYKCLAGETNFKPMSGIKGGGHLPLATCHLALFTRPLI
ncbi:hypothetical protein [Spiroplasma endosymbiont of Acasis viretata]|uniref:hypothetical protein n=1 Tax=Spiroplasma endosymbiont of Acasis viretata TaxID=3066306 RepID=UPI00313F06F5